MNKPPIAILECDLKRPFEINDLKRIFTLAGLLVIGATEKDGLLSVEFTRGNKLTPNMLIKLFKQLSRSYGASQISMAKQSWDAFEAFSKTPGLLKGGSNVRSYIVVEGDRATKYYLETEPYLQNERLARQSIGHLKNVTPVLNSGDDYITMPLLQIAYQWNADSKPTLFPLELFDEIYGFVTEVFNQGYCLVDWNPDGFIQSNGQIYMIDFEYFYKHSAPQNYNISPDFTGEGQERQTAAEGIVTFDKDWQKVLGLTFNQYTTMSLDQKKHQRRIHYWTNYLPSYVNAKISALFKRLKNLLRYKVEVSDEKIVVRNRF